MTKNLKSIGTSMHIINGKRTKKPRHPKRVMSDREKPTTFYPNRSINSNDKQ